MEVTNQLKQVRVAIAQDRLVSPLKKMTNLSVTTIVVLGVGKLNPLHDPGYGVSPVSSSRWTCLDIRT